VTTHWAIPLLMEGTFQLGSQPPVRGVGSVGGRGGRPPPSASKSARLAAGLRAIRAAFAAVLAEVIRERGTPRRTLRPMEKLCHKIDRKVRLVARTQGVERALRFIAEESSRCRVSWLAASPLKRLFGFSLGPLATDEMMAQFSMVKRALPVGPERVVQEALSQHRRDLTSSFPVSDSLLGYFRTFATNWAIERLPQRPGPVPIGRLSDSACLERTRRQGGLSDFVRELLEAAPPVDLSRPPGLLAQEWGDLVAEERVYQAAKADLAKLDRPRSLVTVVREPGLKARIVTKTSGSAVTLGHAARERLFIGLRREPALRDVLRGDEEGAIRTLLPGLGHVLSCDLSRATDLIPLEVTGAIVEGLIASGRFREGEELGLRACSGPQDVKWPTDCPDFVTTSRGILMGLPTTWGLLCLYHLAVLEKAAETEFWGDLTSREAVGRNRPKWVICGDDALVLGEPFVLDEYDRLLKESGSVISAGKHWRSRLGRGVFLEKLLCFRREYGPDPYLLSPHGWPSWVSCDVQDTVTLRGLCFPTAGLHKGALCSVSPDLESDLAAGAVVESLLQGGADPLKVWACQQTLHARALVRCRKARVNPVLPRCLGGAGFITRKGYEVGVSRVASRKHRKAIAVLLNRGTTGPGPGVFSRQWRRAAGSSVFAMAEEDAEGLLGRVPHTIRKDPPAFPGPRRAPWYYCGPHDEFVESQTTLAHHRMALVFPKGIVPRTRTGLGELASRLKRQVAKLIKSWPGAKPWSSGTVRDLLERHKLLVEATHVWLPGTEDPEDPWAPFGVPWAAGDHHRTRLRAIALRGLGNPQR